MMQAVFFYLFSNKYLLNFEFTKRQNILQMYKNKLYKTPPIKLVPLVPVLAFLMLLVTIVPPSKCNNSKYKNSQNKVQNTVTYRVIMTVKD